MARDDVQSVLQAVRDGEVAVDELIAAIRCVEDGASVGVALAELGVVDGDPVLVGDVEPDADPVGPDELDHLFGALPACAHDRGACLLLAAAIVSDYGVDAELLVGADVEDAVDELLAAGSVDAAIERALAASEELDLG